MKQQHTLQPKLRFPEFVEEWKSIKLEDIASKIGSGKTPLGGDKVYQKEGIPFIRSQNVNSDQLILDDICIPIDVHRSMNSSKVIANDILLNITGASIGRSCVVPNDFIEANVNQHVCIIRIEDEQPVFIQKIISSNIGQKLIYETQTGSGREGLNFESIKKFKINIPSLPEQQKIADYLSTIDTKINLLEEKKEQLKRYKKAMMQKLFSQEIRFKPTQCHTELVEVELVEVELVEVESVEAYPEWEEKRLGELLRISNKIKPKDLDLNKLLTVKLHLKGVQRNESTDGLISGATNYFIRKAGQFIYGKQNLFNGGFGIIPKELDGYLSSGDVPSLDIDKELLVAEYLYYYFARESFYKKLESLSSGTGSKRIHESILLQIQITIPSLPEQQKIADFLSAIDESIEKVNEQILQTQSFKKAMLQQMFV